MYTLQGFFLWGKIPSVKQNVKHFIDSDLKFHHTTLVNEAW